MSSSNSNQRLIAIASVIIIALLAGNIFLAVNKYKQDKKLSEQTTQLDEAQQLKADLEKQYYQALADLEAMRGSNEELNALIEKQKEELKASKGRIDGLIANKRDLSKAREEIANLKGQVDQYLAEINTLKEQNGLLTEANQQLTERTNVLESDLSQQRVTNEELSTAKAALMSEKESLQSERERLARKVDIASVVKVSGITVTPQKTKKSGKEVKRDNAKNVDVLNICFNTTANQVVESNSETFHIRIINPIGETLAVEEMGSGVFVSSSNNEQVRYTQSAETSYQNDERQVCAKWAPTTGFQNGNYEVEVYNKGYLAGKTSFVLK